MKQFEEFLRNLDSNDWITALLYVAFFSLIPLGLAIFFVVLNRKNHNQFIHDKELLEQQIQNQLHKSRVEIQEITLKTISQEIHDNIGQILGLVKLNLFAAAGKYEDESLSETHALLGQAISDLRNLNKTFHPDFILRDGIMKAIEQEVAILNRTKRFVIHFEQEGDADFVKGEKEIILFRMIQESLHNVVKHANAHNIHIKAKADSHSAMFAISDDGKGFYPKTIQSGGMGLANLEERARLIDANLEIFSYPGAGTNVIINIKQNGEKY